MHSFSQRLSGECLLWVRPQRGKGEKDTSLRSQCGLQALALTERERAAVGLGLAARTNHRQSSGPESPGTAVCAVPRWGARAKGPV